MGKRIMMLLSLVALIVGGPGCQNQREASDSGARSDKTPASAQVADTTARKGTASTPGTSPQVIVPVEQKTVGSSGAISILDVPGDEHWPNGQLKFHAEQIGDSTEGRVRATYWYENGQKQREEEYLRRRREGPFITWYESGAVEYRGLFGNNQIQDTCWYFWENGQPKQVAQYRDGLKNGPYEQYFETGKIMKKGNFLSDKAEGPYTTYFETGGVEFKGQYKDGLMEGIWEKYYESGRLKAHAEYRAGKKEGRYQQWDEYGVLMFDDTYHENQRVVPPAPGK